MLKNTAAIIITILVVGLLFLPVTPKVNTQALFNITSEDELNPEVLAEATKSPVIIDNDGSSSALPDAGALAPTLVFITLGIALTALGAWRLRQTPQ